MFFIHLLVVSTIYRLYLPFKGMRRVRVAGNDQNGPKRRVWCCLGPPRFFFFFSYFLNIKRVSTIYRLYLPFKGMRRVRVAGDDQNGPKRRVWRRLETL